LWQDDLAMENGVEYRIKTKVRAAANRSMAIKLRNKTNGTTYLEEDINVTTASQYYEFVFVAPVNDNDLRLTYLLGTSDVDLYFDEISMRKVCDGVETNYKLRLKAGLEGPFNAATMTMNDVLKTGGHLPLTEPYSTLGYTQVNGGGETTTQNVLNVSGNKAVVDWIFIEVRDGSDRSVVLGTASALLLRDGQITATDGVSDVLIPNTGAAAVSIVLKYKNHLAIATNDLYTVDQVIDVDFTSSSFVPFSNSPMAMVNGFKLLMSGDANDDGAINTVDKNLIWQVENGTPYSYFSTKSDFNLDGAVNSIDRNFYWRTNNSLIETLD